MWVRESLEGLPKELAAVTTAIWSVPDHFRIGVMRSVILAPPYVWAMPLGGGYAKLKKLPGLMDDFQEMLGLRLIFAEAEQTANRNQALIRWAGFTEIRRVNSRIVYQRSI